MGNIDIAVELGRQALMVAFLLAAPMLVTGLIVGITVSILQAATQVQEQTLSFIPKILGMMAALFIFLPWMLTTVTGFTQQLLQGLPGLLR
ncbi:MAG TPA: flagellar biosynthesis protein FliQ [Planctomycetota bacterium]|nr:flagellar biosynthesis protein FliQ [Planctomycetota bacterium]